MGDRKPEDQGSQFVEYYWAGVRVDCMFHRAPSPGDTVRLRVEGRGPLLSYTVVGVEPARHPAKHPDDPAPFRADVRPS